MIGAQPYYTKFTTVLPMTRILLLLLGDRPSSTVAAQILNMISISIRVSGSFSRKFELVSGWSVLKTILPNVWDPVVNKAAFDLLLGRTNTRPSAESSQAPTPTSATRREEKERTNSTTVSCTHILPTIVSALRSGLIAVANNCHISDEGEGIISVLSDLAATN